MSGGRHGVAGRYLEFCADHLRQLKKLIAEHDVMAVSRIGHALRGNARLIGLNELSSLGGQLEQYCQGTDWAAIDAAYRAIAETVLRLCSEPELRIKVEKAPDAPEQIVEIKKGG